MRRFLIITVGALLTIAVLTVAFLAWAVNDETFLKSQVSRVVLEQTGRQLEISGPLELEIGRRTTVRSGGISFANAHWVDEPVMVRIGQLVLALDVPSLWQGPIRLPRLEIADCAVDLRENDNGQANWDFQPADAAPAEPGEEFTWPLAIERLAIDDCRLSVTRPGQEKTLFVEFEQARLHREAGGRVEGRVTGRLDGEELAVTGWVAPTRAFAEGGRLDLELALTAGEMSLELAGSFDDAAELSGPDLVGHFQGPEIGIVLGPLGLAGLSEGAFDFRAGLTTLETEALVDIDGDLGSLDVHASGQLDRLAYPTRGQVEARVSGSDLAAVVRAIGFDAPLDQHFELGGQLEFQPGAVVLSETRLETDRNRLELDGTLAWKDNWTGTDLAFVFTDQEVGRWLPLAGHPEQALGAATLDGRARVDPAGLLEIDTEIRLADGTLKAQGVLGSVAKPLEPDLQIHFQSADASRLAGLAGLESFPAEPTEIKGRLAKRGDQLQFSGMELQLARNRASGAGTLDLDVDPGNGDVQFDIDIPNLAELGELLGQPDLPEESIKASGRLSWQGGALSFKVEDGAMGDTRLRLDGRIPDLDRPALVDVKFDLHFPDSGVVSYWLPGLLLPKGQLTASGELRNLQDRTRIENVELRLAQTSGTVNGHLQADGSFAAQLRFSGPNLAELEELAGVAFPAEAFEISTELSGRPEHLVFKGLDVRVGKSEVRGDLSYERREKTRIAGALQGRYVNLTHWIQAEQADDAREAAETESRYLFDDTEVLGLYKLGWELDLEATVETLQIGYGFYRDLEIGLRVDEDHSEIRPFSMTTGDGGRFKGWLTIDGRNEIPQLDIELEARDLPVQQVAAKDQDPTTLPRGNYRIDLRGSGRTQRELATSLNGRARMSVGPGDMAPSSLGFLLSDFFTNLIKILVPWSESYEYTRLDCAVAAADVEDGIVTLKPVVINTRQVTIFSEGEIDLHTERIDITFNSKQRKGLGISASDLVNPFIKVGGTLATPAIELDPASTVVKGGLAVATMGISILADSFVNRYLSSKDPCGDAQKAIDERDAESP